MNFRTFINVIENSWMFMNFNRFLFSFLDFRVKRNLALGSLMINEHFTETLVTPGEDVSTLQQS